VSAGILVELQDHENLRKAISPERLNNIPLNPQSFRRITETSDKI